MSYNLNFGKASSTLTRAYLHCLPHPSYPLQPGIPYPKARLTYLPSFLIDLPLCKRTTLH